MTREIAISNYIDEDACCQGEVDVIRLINKIYDSLETQNKALADMVEMQSEKISRLEYEFCGLELKATKLIKIIDSMLDYHPSEVYDLCLKYNYYEPKDN